MATRAKVVHEPPVRQRPVGPIGRQLRAIIDEGDFDATYEIGGYVDYRGARRAATRARSNLSYPAGVVWEWTTGQTPEGEGILYVTMRNR